MSTLIQGLNLNYTVTSTDLTTTPAESYAAWATELGVSPTSSLATLDGDDAAYPIYFAAPPIVGGTTKGFFTTEGGVGWYATNLTIVDNVTPTHDMPDINRFYQLSPLADYALTFHPRNSDSMSSLIKLQKAGDTTILSGEIRPNGTSTTSVAFALRFNGDRSWQLDLKGVTGTTPIYLLKKGDSAWVGWPSSGVQEEYSLGVVSAGISITLTGVPSAGTLVQKAGVTRIQPGATPWVLLGSLDIQPIKLASTIKAEDLIFGGKGRITGTVKEAGTPEHAVRRRVRLHRMVDGLLVKEAWSDPVTGAYAFNHINPTWKFYIVSHDHILNYNAVIKDNLTPESMP